MTSPDGTSPASSSSTSQVQSEITQITQEISTIFSEVSMIKNQTLDIIQVAKELQVQVHDESVVLSVLKIIKASIVAQQTCKCCIL